MLEIAANISTLYRELPMAQRFDAARAAGFDGVEIQFPYTEAPHVLAHAAESAGMPVVLINGPVLPGAHPFGIAARPDMQQVFRAQLPQICEYAEALRVRFVHVLAGSVGPHEDRERCWDVYVENLLFAAGILGERGVRVLIEPLNPLDVAAYFLDSLSAAQGAIERCGHQIGLQFDAYHVARMGLDVAAEFTRLAAVAEHVQFADVPGRHEPGTGRVPFRRFVAALEEAHYAGWVAAEYTPSAATAAGMHWLTAWRSWSP